MKDNFSNLVNEILYTFIAKGMNFTLPANYESFIDNGYASNVNIYPVIRKIVTPMQGVRWVVRDVKTGEPATDNYLDLLLQRPNKQQGRNSFIDEAVCWRLITGNRYIYWVAPEFGLNKGKPMELTLLPASQVEIVQGTWEDPVKGYKLLIGDKSREIPAENVVHGRTTNLKYDKTGPQLYGMSPLAPALKVMTATNKGYDRLSNNFANGGPDVIITGTDANSPEWTEEQKQGVLEGFKRLFKKGTERYMFKKQPVNVHEIGKSPVDLGILEFMKVSLRDYCNIYNVPSALMNDNEYATQSANASEYMRMLWNNAIIPELEMLKEDLNQIAAVYNKATNQVLEYDYDLSDIPELLSDKGVQAQSLSTAWWLTPNQRLIAMGFDPDPDPRMDIRYVPMGLVPINELIEPANNEEAQKWLNQRAVKY